MTAGWERGAGWRAGTRADSRNKNIDRDSDRTTVTIGKGDAEMQGDRETESEKDRSKCKTGPQTRPSMELLAIVAARFRQSATVGPGRNKHAANACVSDMRSVWLCELIETHVKARSGIERESLSFKMVRQNHLAKVN